MQIDEYLISICLSIINLRKERNDPCKFECRFMQISSAHKVSKAANLIDDDDGEEELTGVMRCS